MTDNLAGRGVRLPTMIQIELPCCDATVDLEPMAETVRCEACAIEHVLAADARPARPDHDATPLALAAAA